MAQRAWSGDERPAYASGVLRELIFLAVTLALGVSLVAAIMLAPDAFLARVPQQNTGARSGFGLAQLLPYLDAIRDYTAGVFTGNLGQDARGDSVNRDVLPAARHTLELLAVSIAAAIPLGLVWGGLLASARQPLVKAALFGLNTLLNSLPTFMLAFLATQAVATITLRTGVRLTYVQGYGLDRHLILPAGALALRGAAYMARAIQVAQEDILQQDWVRVARAKGLGGLALWRRHILPALKLPVLGSTLGMVRVVVGGVVIVDYLYNWGGLGSYMLRGIGMLSVRGADEELATGAAVLLVVLFVAVDALGRLALRRADPRLRGGFGE
jgi:ABC-type dipeptide/oligopeptide/nickel transport system permease component